MVAGGVMRWPSSHKVRSNIGFCQQNLQQDLIILVKVKHLFSRFLLKETLLKKKISEIRDCGEPGPQVEVRLKLRSQKLRLA